MKTCNLYGQTIEAYTPKELDSLKHHGAIAGDIWSNAWLVTGAEDRGTCTGGKGLRVWYLDKGKRKPMEMTITRCNWVQGNLSASRSVKPALDYLKEYGIEAEYYDGWMD